MNLNLTTLGLSSLSLLSVTSSLIADDPKPNIIFFMADDHQAMTLGCMGNTQVKTPTLDSLAAKGLIFDKAYATSPICMPSRATVMTGMYEYKTGCNFNTGALSTLDWKETSYPMLLKKNGYSIAFAGKWGYKLEDSYDYISDFDAWGGFETFRQGSYNTHDNVSLTSYASTYPHVTRALGAFGSDFIKNHANTGTPFCLSISFKAPHKPHDNIDPADQALFPGVTFNTALNYGDQYFNPLPPQPKLGRQRAQWNEWAPPEYQNHIKAYYQLIAGLDSAVKMILDELDNQGIANNTIIIYTSDNGYALGSHGFQGKTLPYEEQSRIPLIIYDPLGNVHGERTSTLVANIDFAPTILAYAGITKPNKMDGKSLKDLTRVNKDAKIHDDILLIQNWASGNCDFPKALSVVNDSWKYIFWCYGNPDITPAEQLYNLTNDPHEIADTIKNNPVNLPDMRSKYDYYLSLWASGARPKYERAITLYDRTIPWQQKDFIGASGTYVSKEAYRDYVGAEPPPGLIGAHKLFVYEGIGNGRYDTGETGIITANIHPGKVFDQWVGDIANVTDVFAPQTTVVMPDANILITATFKDPSPNTYTVSGTVSGIVNGGVLISLDNNSQTVITDTNGYYSISGVINGDHEIKAIRSGCTFDPPTQTFSIVGSDESNINFSASSTKIISYEISGTITEGGTPSANVDVNINGNVTTSVKTDANGNYIFAALPEGTYTITPNLSGFSFAPVNQSVYIITSSVTGIDFTATPDSSTTYKLTVENGTGSGNFAENANVNITATIPGGKTFKEWSGDGAQYAADKNSATTTITMPNHDITITANFQNITVNTYSISGTISGDIISGVTISADSTHSAVSDSSGNYTINDLTAGSYTVKPVYNGYTFSPSERSVTVNDTDISAVDFTSDEIIPSGGVPTSISGCMLWLDASDPNADGTQATGNIETWKDKSGTGHNAVQSNSTMQAIATSNALNGNSVLTFDGTDDFYSFNKITNIRTVFWVLKEVNQTSDGSSLHFLLGDDGNYDFHRGSGTLWDSTYAADGIKNGATRVDRADFDGLTADIPADKYIIVSLVTSADLTASQVTKDRGMGRYWDGGIAEIIIYNQPLSDTDRDTVEDYLYNKWFASSPTQFSISGNITSNGTPLAQVSVELSGNASSTTTTDASGNYSFANLPDGNTYTITPALSGYSFNPTNKTVTISSADQTGIDFTATPDSSPTYKLTVENGTGSGDFAENANVNITATVPGGKTFKEWSGDGAQYAADKNSATTTITMPNHDITITANFQNITVNTYSISGTISGDIISGITISADSTHSAVSDSSGNYTINDLTAGSYTVKPVYNGYTFSPSEHSVSVTDTDISAVDFISDEIIPSGGVPTSISGCVLWLDASDPNADGAQATGNIETWKDKSGTGNNAVQSDSTMQAVATSNALNGNSVLTFDGTDDFYSFNKITNIRTVFWVLQETDYSTSHFLLGDSDNFDFSRGTSDSNVPNGIFWHRNYASENIKNGKTYLNRNLVADPTAEPLPLNQYNIVSLVTTGDVTASTITKDRNFSDRTWKGEIAEIIIYNQPLSDTDRTKIEDYLYNKWFASSPTQFSIIGNITSNGTPLAQVSVELSGNTSSTTTTDASGNYSFANLPDGNTYTITPALSGYSFNPANKTVTISNADQTGIDFTATPDSSPTYRLTVENGTGSGNFAENTKVNITATVPGGKTFKEWSGDGAQYAADKNSATTTITIPNHDITITANFQNITVDTYSISGTISGDIISGVTISADSTHSAVSDSSGNYTINNLTAGSYTVTPNSKDYIFEPINKIVILQNTDIQNLNFQAIKSTSPSEKNNPPVALEDEYFVEQSKILTVSDAAGVLANDIDIDNDKLTANLKTGSLSLNQNGGFTFTAPSKTGDITFTYQANDGQSDSNVTTVIIHVIAAGTPLPPTPIDDQYSATIDQTITASHENGVLVNDLNLNGNETVTISNNVTNGKLTLNNDGTFTYTPNKDFTGLDRFVYQISGTTETASVYLKIMPQKNIKISLGSLLEFKAEDIPNLGSDKFIKPPKLYGLYQGKKMSLKKVKSSTTTLFKGIWSKKIRLYDKSVLKNGYKSYFEKHGSLKPQKISIALKGKTATKKNIDLTIKDVFLVPPVISSINGVSVTDPTQPAVSKGSLITIQGQYFGTKLPKVSIEVNGKLLRCKVDKNSLSYKNNKGKLSAMDPLTGESSIKIVLPVKNLQKGTYPIVLDNKIGIATTPGENAILPEITIK